MTSYGSVRTSCHCWTCGSERASRKETQPICLLRPANVDELQRLMQLANEARLNLTVASSTGRHCKGGLAAAKQNMRVEFRLLRVTAEAATKSDFDF